MQYKCSICGKVHTELPHLSFDSPFNYGILSDKDKEEIAELSSDFCVIKYEDQTDRFIRAVLFQKINDHSESLGYGIWVSLSEKNFNDYTEHFEDNDYEATYFGFLCSNISGYETTLSIRTNVELRKGGNRPEVIPHEDQMDNPFVMDYYNGITLAEAERRIHEIID
jgi:hypothetical protein